MWAVRSEISDLLLNSSFLRQHKKTRYWKLFGIGNGVACIHDKKCCWAARKDIHKNGTKYSSWQQGWLCCDISFNSTEQNRDCIQFVHCKYTETGKRQKKEEYKRRSLRCHPSPGYLYNTFMIHFFSDMSSAVCIFLLLSVSYSNKTWRRNADSVIILMYCLPYNRRTLYSLHWMCWCT